MGVYHQHFILYGYEIGRDALKAHAEDPDDPAYKNPLIDEYGYRDDGKNNVVVVSDGRSGEYCYIGVLQYKSNSTRNGPATIPPQTLSKPRSEEMLELGEAVGKYDLPVDGEPQHHIFTHTT